MTIEYEDIEYDVLDAAIGRCFGYMPNGFVEYERQEVTSASVVYKLSHDELGSVGEIRIDKLAEKRTEVIFVKPNRILTPDDISEKGKKKIKDENIDLKTAMSRMMIDGLDPENYDKRKKHYNDIVEALLNRLKRERIWPEKQKPQNNKTKQKRGPKDKGGINIDADKVTIKGDMVSGDKHEIHYHGDVQNIGTLISNSFNDIYKQIESRPEEPDVDKEEIKETVKKIETEVKMGEKANPSTVERWLKFLGSMAEDIFDVTVATLGNPVTGVAKAIQKIAGKTKEEMGKA